MIVNIDSAKVGPLLFRLVAKPGPEASRYYVTVKHDIDVVLTAIEFSGHNLEHCERKFGRLVDQARCRAEGGA